MLSSVLLFFPAREFAFALVAEEAETSSSSSSRSITVALAAAFFPDAAFDAAVDVDAADFADDWDDVAEDEADGTAVGFGCAFTAFTALGTTGGFANSGFAYCRVQSLAFESCFFLSRL